MFFNLENNSNNNRNNNDNYNDNNNMTSDNVILLSKCKEPINLVLVLNIV